MKLKHLWWVLLVVYVALEYWLTVFSRVFTGSAGVEWQPFWTYKAILNEGKEYLVADIVNNVLLFVPIGALAGLVVTQIPQIARKWWKGWTVVLFAGILLSVGIEALQLYLKRGLCETDDIIHNTLGCMTGIALVKLVTLTTKKYFYAHLDSQLLYEAGLYESAVLGICKAFHSQGLGGADLLCQL